MGLKPAVVRLSVCLSVATAPLMLPPTWRFLDTGAAAGLCLPLARRPLAGEQGGESGGAYHLTACRVGA